MDLNTIYNMCDNAIYNLLTQYQTNGTINQQEANVVFNEWKRQRNAQISNQVQRHGTNDFNLRANSIANQFVTSIIHQLHSNPNMGMMQQPQMYGNYTNTFNSVNANQSNAYTGFYGTSTNQQPPQQTGTFDIMDCQSNNNQQQNKQQAVVQQNQVKVKFDYVAPTAENTKTYVQNDANVTEQYFNSTDVPKKADSQMGLTKLLTITSEDVVHENLEAYFNIMKFNPKTGKTSNAFVGYRCNAVRKLHLAKADFIKFKDKLNELLTKDDWEHSTNPVLAITQIKHKLDDLLGDVSHTTATSMINLIMNRINRRATTGVFSNQNTPATERCTTIADIEGLAKVNNPLIGLAVLLEVIKEICEYKVLDVNDPSQRALALKESYSGNCEISDLENITDDKIIEESVAKFDSKYTVITRPKYVFMMTGLNVPGVRGEMMSNIVYRGVPDNTAEWILAHTDADNFKYGPITLFIMVNKHVLTWYHMQKCDGQLLLTP